MKNFSRSAVDDGSYPLSVAQRTAALAGATAIQQLQEREMSKEFINRKVLSVSAEELSRARKRVPNGDLHSS